MLSKLVDVDRLDLKLRNFARNILKNLQIYFKFASYITASILFASLFGCANAVKSADGKNYEECYPIIDRLERELQKTLEAETTTRPVEVLKGRFCIISPVTTDMLMVPLVGPLITAANQRTTTLSFTARVGEKLVSAEEKSFEQRPLADGSDFYKQVVRKALASYK